MIRAIHPDHLQAWTLQIPGGEALLNDVRRLADYLAPAEPADEMRCWLKIARRQQPLVPACAGSQLAGAGQAYRQANLLTGPYEPTSDDWFSAAAVAVSYDIRKLGYERNRCYRRMKHAGLPKLATRSHPY